MAAAVVVVAENGDVLGDPQRGVGGIRQAWTDVADLDVAAAGPDHLQAFLGDARKATDFHHHVGAPAARQFFYARGARGGRRQRRQVDELVGAEHSRHLEPLGYAVDDDDAACSSLTCDRDRVQTKAARALNDHRLADLDVRQVPATGDLGQRTIDAGYDFVGQLVRHFEHDVVGVQVEVVAKRAL